MDHTITIDKKTGHVCSFTGDAVLIYRTALLSSSIKLYHTTGGRIIPTRGMGITKMLKLAEEILGKKYKRTELEKCIAHLDIWVQEAKALVNIVVR